MKVNFLKIFRNVKALCFSIKLQPGHRRHWLADLFKLGNALVPLALDLQWNRFT